MAAIKLGAALVDVRKHTTARTACRRSPRSRAQRIPRRATCNPLWCEHVQVDEWHHTILSDTPDDDDDGHSPVRPVGVTTRPHSCFYRAAEVLGSYEEVGSLVVGGVYPVAVHASINECGSSVITEPHRVALHFEEHGRPQWQCPPTRRLPPVTLVRCT